MKMLSILALLGVVLGVWAIPAAAVLVLDADGDGLDLSGQVLTVHATGIPQTLHWTTPGTDDALVVIDAAGVAGLGITLRRRGDVMLEDITCQAGLEVERAGSPPVVAADAFEVLHLLDDDGDGAITSADAVFAHLKLFTDSNGDGTMDPGELSALSSSVSSLPGSASSPPVADGHGNVVTAGSAAMTSGLVHECSDVALASPPATLYGGASHHPVGHASLSSVGGKLVVSNLGSSGQDGVQVRSRAGHRVVLDDRAAVDGSFVRYETQYDSPTGERVGVRGTVTVSGGAILLRHTPFDNGATGFSATVRVRDRFGNVTVHTLGSTDDLACASPPSSVRLDSIWDGAFAGSSPPGELVPMMVYEFDPPVSVQAPGAPAVDAVLVHVYLSKKGYDYYQAQSVLQVSAGGPAPVEDLVFAEAAMVPFHHVVHAEGDALLSSHDGLDNDCDGVCDGDCDDGDRFSRPPLVVSNIGSSGLDGVRLEMPAGGTGMGIPVQCPSGECATEVASDFRALSRYLRNGVAFYTSARVTVSAPRVLTVAFDPDNGGGPATVRLYRGGVFQDEATMQGIDLTNIVCDGTQEASFDLHSFDWSDKGGVVYIGTCDVTLPGRASVRCDEIRLVATPEMASATIEDVTLQVSSPTMCSVTIPAIQARLRVTSLDGLPPGEPSFEVRASGLADVNRDGMDDIALMRANIGSMGLDGVEVKLPPPTGTHHRAHVSWSPLGDEVETPSAEMALRVRRGSSIGTMHVTRAPGERVVTPDFGASGATQVRVVALHNGAVVANEVVDDQQEAARMPEWPTGGGIELAPPTAEVYLTTGGHFITITGSSFKNAKTPTVVFADALLIVPIDGNPVPATGDVSMEVLARGAPYFDLTDIGFGESQEVVPVALQDFVAVATEDGVELRWDVAVDPQDLAGFRIHRREGNGFVVAHEGLLPVSARSFLDRGVARHGAAYRLEVVLKDGGAVDSREIVSDALPRALWLGANAPNPFNPSTLIHFRVPSAGRVTLTIHDLAGRRVATLVDQEMAAGSSNVQWTGIDDHGHAVASGTYVYRLRTASGELARKMTLLK